MARLSAFSCLFMLMLCVGVCKGDWCVAKITVPEVALQGFINSACEKLDCSAIKPGGSCYKPDNVLNHSSYVLNLYYRKNNVCPMNIGTIALTDPSGETCTYT